MSASIIDAANRFFLRLIDAYADGRIDRVEAQELRREFIDELQGLGDGVSVSDVVDFFAGLFDRTPEELIALAGKAKENGHHKRAARLLARAEG